MAVFDLLLYPNVSQDYFHSIYTCLFLLFSTMLANYYPPNDDGMHQSGLNPAELLKRKLAITDHVLLL
jgi:hypothetical protein